MLSFLLSKTKTLLQVVGLARRKDRLDSLSNSLSGNQGQFFGFPADVTKEENIISAFKWVDENIGPIHILINNAGVGTLMNFANLQTEVAKNVLETNILAVSITIREALKYLKANNINGHIININSTAGHAVPDYPGFGVYSASKYAVTALTEALYLELKRSKMGTKVTVSMHLTVFVGI